MLHPNDAESKILSLVQPFQAQQDIETVDLLSAHGRVLAQDVVSQLDFPHWDNSAMDGYSVRFEDVKTASKEHPITLTVVEEIPAGCQPQHRIQFQQAARIFTGAIVPEGSDTIVIQEDTDRAGDQVTVFEAPVPKAFVRHKAAFYQAGSSLLPQGTVLNAPEIAVLAAAQCPQVTVYRRPVVAILSTGDELVSIDQPLQAGQIVDSNRYALSALIQSSGATPTSFGIIPDTPEALKRAIATALEESDLIVSSGGVSVGDYDYVDRILEELGATLHVRSVAVKPGKPLTVASFQEKLYFGLPGNPVSALVSFWRFVQPALMKLSGHPGPHSPTFVSGRSRHDLKAGGKRETYLWGQVRLVGGEYEFSLAGGSHSSGNLINLASTNALAIVPIGQTHISANSPVSIMLVGPPR
ncbi:MAG: gephyrin-like molybdotransferase Glp [Leptolyngbyaceae bacterium]|nr:gephyrin-like molybdotransferase Glp [Leptolyngbyaceae bacterium]